MVSARSSPTGIASVPILLPAPTYTQTNIRDLFLHVGNTHSMKPLSARLGFRLPNFCFPANKAHFPLLLQALQPRFVNPANATTPRIRPPGWGISRVMDRRKWGRSQVMRYLPNRGHSIGARGRSVAAESAPNGDQVTREQMPGKGTISVFALQYLVCVNVLNRGFVTWDSKQKAP